ncbi:MAG: hypothetical protein BWY05_01130 [Euryarchaeota archaeon ADurb.Bin165]|nr:MAG: hypothetical protein BWY05_01130 [Euryarchaeota archaeon ADurb.Bin165]
MPDAITSSNASLLSEYAICLATSLSSPNSLMYLEMVSPIISGISIAKNRFGVTLTGSTSVSGYMRAAPGSGLMYAVEPPSSIFLVSFKTPSNASSALRMICCMAQWHRSGLSATMTTQSSGDASRAFLRLITSSSVTP